MNPVRRELRARAAPPLSLVLRDCPQQKMEWEGAHLCEVGVSGVEDCGPEPSIEGDLRREAAGECGTQRWGRPPQRVHLHLTLGKAS